jgi:hypothetical protein
MSISNSRKVPKSWARKKNVSPCPLFLPASLMMAGQQEQRADDAAYSTVRSVDVEHEEATNDDAAHLSEQDAQDDFDHPNVGVREQDMEDDDTEQLIQEQGSFRALSFFLSSLPFFLILATSSTSSIRDPFLTLACTLQKPASKIMARSELMTNCSRRALMLTSPSQRKKGLSTLREAQLVRPIALY